MFLDTLDEILEKASDPFYLEDSFDEEDFKINTFDLFKNYKREFPNTVLKKFSEVDINYTGFVRNDLDRYNMTKKVFQIVENNKNYFTLKDLFQTVYFMEQGKIVFSSKTIKDEVEENITHTFFHNNTIIEFNYYFMSFLETFPSSLDEFFPSKEELARRRRQEPWVKKKSFFKINFGYDEQNKYFLPGVENEKITFEVDINQPYLEGKKSNKFIEKYVDVKIKKSFAAFEGIRNFNISLNLSISLYKKLIKTVRDGELSIDALKYFAGDSEVRLFDDYRSYSYFGLNKSFDRQKLSEVLDSIQERTKMISELYTDPRFIETANLLVRKLDARNFDESFEESFKKINLM